MPGVFDVGCNHSSKYNTTRVTRQLADINGDGMPDILFKKDGDDDVQVQLNLGGGFGPVEAWRSTNAWPIDLAAPLHALDHKLQAELGELVVTGPSVLAASGTQDSTSNGCHGSVSIAELVRISGGVTLGNTRDTFELGLLDIDGDGVADHVLHRARDDGDPAHVFVKHNEVTGKANLLRTIRRPLGGTITLDYTRTANTVDMPHSRQVLTRVEVDDGVDLGPSFGSPNVVTTMSYEGGLYQRDEKEFFGFAKVTTTRADGVTVEDEYENQSFPLHGRLLSETRRDSGGRLFQRHALTYAVLAVLAAGGTPVVGAASCSDNLPPLLTRVDTDACTPRFGVVVRDEDTRAEGGPESKTRTITDLAADHDRFGNVLASTDTGDDAIATDDVHVLASYQNDTTRWILGRATSLAVRGGGASGPIVRSRTGDFDELGELVAVHVDTGAGIATTTLGYDAFGNLNHLETPPNEAGQSQTYDLTFDPDVATYPTTTIDGFGYVSTASYDVRFGIATSETDIDHAQWTRTLDAFGRLTEIRGPYDTGAPGLAMAYHPEEHPPRAVTTTRPSAPPDYTGPVPAPTLAVTFTDGLARTIELRKTAVVDEQPGIPGMTTSGLVAYDNVGRAIRTQNPFFDAGASTNFIAPRVTETTSVRYDALDRPISTTYPDGATESASFDIAPSPNGGATLFLSRAVDPNGHARESYLDHLGRTRAFVEHPSTTSSSVTRYDYLATGELSHIVDAEGNQTALSYDLRGLRTLLDNPDTGTIEDHFDLMGNRIALVEPNHRALGTRVHYLYDRDRLATIDYPSKSDVTYTYGAPDAPNFGAGRVAQVSDESGTQQHEYGALGEVRRTVRTFVDPAHQVGTAVFDVRVTTDSFGRQLRVVYPDGEQVTNSYDAAGMLAQVDGAGAGWSRTYANELRYDVFGNRTHARLGNGDVSNWTYDPARVRLTSLVTTLASATKVQDLRYTYDPAGNPTAIENALAATPVNNTLPGTATQSFAYDGVDRLVHATGAGTLGSNKRTTYDLAFTYSASHNITTKTSTHLVLSNNGSSSAPSATNYNSPYTYAPGRPHLATQIGALSITYDPSGNPTSRTDSGSGEQLVWDDDNRMVRVTNGTGVNQRNVYDASGVRVLRHGQGDTIFASPLFEFNASSTGTKHIFAGSTRVASVLAPFTSGANQAPAKKGTAYFVHENHLGSTNVVTTEDGSVNDAHEYFPDGAAWIDSGKSSSVDGFLFSGKPFDPDTGFYDFGQRFYDPRASLWLGVDPAFVDSPSKSVGRPTMLALPSYVAQNPVRFTDPDGRDLDFWRNYVPSSPRAQEAPSAENRRGLESDESSQNVPLMVRDLRVDLAPSIAVAGSGWQP